MPIDVTALLRENEEDETAIVNGSQAARITLEGTWPAGRTAGEEPLIDAAASEVPADE